jgi:hypothetical protein
MHDKIYINSDDAIERNNKFISFGQNETVLANKGVILKNGKTITLDKNDIRRKLMKKRVKYNYFAINGLEKVCYRKVFCLEESPILTVRPRNARSISNQI